MIRLLIADDEEDIRLGISELIDWEAHGIRLVGAASDGLGLLDMLNTLRPDIALVDIQMPGLTGLQAIEQMQGHRDIAYIILTGHDEFSYAREALRLGVDDYLLKPCSPEDILEAVEKAGARLALPRRETEDDLFQLLREKGCVGVYYPSTCENELMRKLYHDSESEIEASLEQFIDAVCEKNDSLRRQMTCYAIFLFSVYRECVLRDIPWQPSTVACFSGWQRFDSGQGGDALKQAVHIVCAMIEKHESANPSVLRAAHYIDEHYAEPITLNDLAEKINLSPAYLSSQFSRCLGKTVTAYITQVRLEHACELLRSTDKKVVEIAWLTGFSNEKYFSESFRQNLSVSPGKYRNKHNK